MRDPHKSSVNIYLMKKLKSTVTIKSDCAFYELRWKKLLKVAAFVIFPTSVIVLFENSVKGCSFIKLTKICHKKARVKFWLQFPFKTNTYYKYLPSVFNLSLVCFRSHNHTHVATRNIEWTFLKHTKTKQKRPAVAAIIHKNFFLIQLFFCPCLI